MWQSSYSGVVANNTPRDISDTTADAQNIDATPQRPQEAQQNGDDAPAAANNDPVDVSHPNGNDNSGNKAEEEPATTDEATPAPGIPTAAAAGDTPRQHQRKSKATNSRTPNIRREEGSNSSNNSLPGPSQPTGPATPQQPGGRTPQGSRTSTPGSSSPVSHRSQGNRIPVINNNRRKVNKIPVIDSDGYKLIQSKRDRRVMYGRRTRDTGLQAAPIPKRYIGVSRLATSDPALVKGYLEHEGIGVHNVFKVSHEDARFNSYKISVDICDLDKVFDENLWQIGTVVKLWQYKKRQRNYSSSDENESVSDRDEEDESNYQHNGQYENGLTRAHYRDY